MLSRFLGSFRVRALATGAVVWTALFAAAGWTSYRVLRGALERSVNGHLLAGAEFVAAEARPWVPRAASTEPGATVDPRLRRVLDNAVAGGLAKDVVLLDSRGLVLADATGERVPGFPTPDLGPGEWERLRSGQGVTMEPKRGAFGALQQSVYVPAGAGSVLRLEADPRQLAVLDAYRRVSLALGVAGLVLCALVGALSAGWVLKPIQWMADAARGAAGGTTGGAAPPARNDELGQAAHAVASSLRALEADRIEARLRREMAEQRSKELNLVARAIAHEVRNPLAVIRGQADLLRKSFPMPAAEPLLVRVREQVDLLDRVVGRFLELGRAPRLERKRLDSGTLVRGLAESLRGALPGPDWAIREEDAAHAVVFVDQALLEGALLNLGQNALQAMPRGGEVTVASSLRDGRLCLEVGDQGPGIAPEARARLFEPFFTTKPAGTGLGLALARRAAEAHGGELLLLPSERGARFGLFLPLDGDGGG